jgi:uncharacterized integral membrane protein (TIGR00697 family)
MSAIRWLNLSRYLILRLPDKRLNELANGLTDSDEEDLTRILRFRLVLHAYAYSPVFALILLAILPAKAAPSNESLVGILVAVGSLVIALAKLGAAGPVDKYGPQVSLRLGVSGVFCASLLFSAIAGFSIFKSFGLATSVILLVIAQVVIGFGLGCIDGPDRLLLLQCLERSSTYTPNGIHDRILQELNQNLKIAGGALGAFFGGIVVITIRHLALLLANTGAPFSAKWELIAGAVVFAITALVQLMAIISVKRANINSTVKQLSPLFETLHDVILRDPILYSWITISSLVEGGFLMLGVLFSLGFLTGWLSTPITAAWKIILCPGLFWLNVIVGTWGSATFRYLDDKNNEERRFAFSFCTLFGVIVLVILHLLLLGLNNWDPWMDLAAVFTMAYLRGFAQPLLTGALESRIKASEWGDRRLTITSMSTAFGRISHFVAAGLMVLIGTWITAKSQGQEAVLMKQSLAIATAILLAVVGIVCIVGYRIIISGRGRGKSEGPAITWGSELIAVSFAVCLVMSNILGTTSSEDRTLKWNDGAFAYATVFILVELTTEKYGAKAGFRLWRAGLLSFFVVLACRWPSEGIRLIRSEDLLVLTGSFLSFFVAQWFDVNTFRLLKELSGGDFLLVRFAISGFVAQAVDTPIFAMVAYRRMDWHRFLRLLVGQMIMKWSATLVIAALLVLGLSAWGAVLKSRSARPEHL